MMSVELNKEVTPEKEPVQVADAGGEGGDAHGAVDKGAAASASKEGPPASVEESQDGEKEPPAFVARTKFKVRDSNPDNLKRDPSAQIDKDVPDWAKGLMKDESTEKELISLLEKAEGIDAIKATREQIRQERDHVSREFQTVQKTIAEVRGAYQRGDIDAFLEKLSIPQERMLQWAVEKVQYSQLPPEQQKMIDDSRSAKRNELAAQQQLEMSGSQYIEQARSLKAQLLEASFSRPDVQQFSQSFDAKKGRPGAFRDSVIAAGEYEWVRSQGKVDLSPQQAIEQVMKEWSPFMAQASQPGAEAGTKAPPQNERPATIPNIQGRAQSPLKSKPKSIDDLKKLRDHASSG